LKRSHPAKGLGREQPTPAGSRRERRWQAALFHVKHDPVTGAHYPLACGGVSGDSWAETSDGGGCGLVLLPRSPAARSPRRYGRQPLTCLVGTGVLPRGAEAPWDVVA